MIIPKNVAAVLRQFGKIREPVFSSSLASTMDDRYLSS